MAARLSFSTDSRIVTRSMPKSILLKDHLLDDLSSCSSNGFRSYPRRQCCTKVRYLIEIDLNSKHNKLPSTQKHFFKSRSKSKPKPKAKLKLKLKSSSVLHKASAAVANVFKSFHSSRSSTGSSKLRKANFLPRNLSRKLSKHGFWKKTIDQNAFDETKESVLPPVSKLLASGKTDTSNSDSAASENSCFTVTSDSLTTHGSSKNNVAQNDVEESDKFANKKMNMENGLDNVQFHSEEGGGEIAGNGTEKLLREEKDRFSPNSVMDFPCDNDDEDEVSSPFHDSYLYVKGSKRKLISKVQRTNSLKPVRLEDRIILSESKVHNSIIETSSQTQRELEESHTKNKAIALLKLFKATIPSHGLSECMITENVLLDFFTEQVTEGNVTNYAILQDAKDWVNGLTREMFDSDDYKLAYVRYMEKQVKWLTYGGEVEKEEVVSVIEYEVFSSLVEEMLLDLYL